MRAVKVIKDGKVIGRYKSVKAAAEVIGTDPWNVRKCLNGIQSSTNGYKIVPDELIDTNDPKYFKNKYKHNVSSFVFRQVLTMQCWFNVVGCIDDLHQFRKVAKRRLQQAMWNNGIVGDTITVVEVPESAKGEKKKSQMSVSASISLPLQTMSLEELKYLFGNVIFPELVDTIEDELAVSVMKKINC